MDSSRSSNFGIIKRGPVIAALAAYVSAVALVARYHAAAVLRSAVLMAFVAVCIRLMMQGVHALYLRRADRSSPRDYVFMSAIGLVAAVGVLVGLLRDNSKPSYLIAHWVLSWLVFATEMHYNELAAGTKISYLSDAKPFRWLSLSSLRFLYGGTPQRETRAHMFFMLMLTVAVTPSLPS